MYYMCETFPLSLSLYIYTHKLEEDFSLSLSLCIYIYNMFTCRRTHTRDEKRDLEHDGLVIGCGAMLFSPWQ